MRDKRRTRRRATSHVDGGPYEPGAADWVLANEVGWGVPHGLVALLAGIVVGVGTVAWQVRRSVAAVRQAKRRRGN